MALTMLRSTSVRPAAASRSRSVRVQASSRPLWLPDVQAPKHLNGTLPGDSGFDPLGLGQSPDRLKWYAEAEKTNGRWAMIAVAGILGQEALNVGIKWWDHAKVTGPFDIPVIAQVPILFLVLGFLETKRYQGFKQTGTSGFINSFPFDPMGQNSPSMAVKEVKNGRLAMVAFIGFAVQALATRMQPIEGLMAHLSDPSKNITYYLTHLPETLAKQ